MGTVSMGVAVGVIGWVVVDIDLECERGLRGVWHLLGNLVARGDVGVLIFEVDPLDWDLIASEIVCSVARKARGFDIVDRGSGLRKS